MTPAYRYRERFPNRRIRRAYRQNRTAQARVLMCSYMDRAEARGVALAHALGMYLDGWLGEL